MVGLYLATVSRYRAVPERTANLVLQQLTPSTRLERLPAGGWQLWVAADAGGETAVAHWAPFVVHLLFLNLALVPALLLATPAPFRDSLRRLGWAIPLLWLVQTLSLIALARGQLCLSSAPGSFLCLWLLRLVYASGQLSAAVIWALLSWRYWLRRERTPAEP